MQIARALLLDAAHRVFALRAPDDTWHAPGTIARVGERPLVALNAFARERLSLDLPHPCGARGEHDFAFVLPPGTKVVADESKWVPLRALDSLADADALWALYCDALLGGWAPPLRTLDVFFMGREPMQAALLAHQVAKGPKRATTLWGESARVRGEPTPTVGLVSIVTDGFGVPVCAIRTTRVDEVRFGEVDESVAQDEHEGDATLEDWKSGHRAYFEAEAKELGLAFGEESVVIVERFEVLKVLGR